MSVTLTTLAQWEEWAGSYSRLPFIRRYNIESLQVSSWERTWSAASEHAFVLESGKGGRYTFLGLHAAASIRGKGDQAELSDGTTRTGKPLAVLKDWMLNCQGPVVEGAPKFTGGCVGYLSYDIARTLERLPQLSADDLDLPDYVFMQVDELWVLDQQEQQLYCAMHMPWSQNEQHPEQYPAQQPHALEASYAAAAVRIEQMKRLWDELVASPSAADQEAMALRSAMMEEHERQGIAAAGVLPGMQTPFARDRFEAAVRHIQRYIGQGDVFQVNLSLRQDYELSSSPEQMYEWLRLVNPSPYMGMLRFPDFQIVSASPELLVKQTQGRVSTRPIAGTRKRGRTAEEDAAMEHELRTNEKENAEHIMLVDLERNDLGRISKYGTVSVSELMVIERYSHVMHLVSEVEGELAAGKDAYDVLAATFPGGTITGAPKVRTMEIIEELEPVRRGPYTGSFGWIDYNGDMEFNIIIRTLTMKDRMAYIQTGAGIVIDSVPEREYAECLNKAKALCTAIQFSERETKGLES